MNDILTLIGAIYWMAMTNVQRAIALAGCGKSRIGHLQCICHNFRTLLETQGPVPENQAVPRSVLALGFVSMFMDTSSEMIHSLLPVFIVSILGVSTTALGVLEGIAEGTVNIVKIFSGALSDWIGKRKPTAIAGYGMAALTKPLFPIANSFGAVFAARLLDRTGKGVREAPRDALIADLTPRQVRGASYGLRQRCGL